MRILGGICRAYRIVYGGNPVKRKKDRFWSGRLHLLTAIWFVLFIVSLKFLWTEDLETILPESCVIALNALDHMASDIRGGCAFGEAVTAFCREIIAGAGLA